MKIMTQKRNIGFDLVEISRFKKHARAKESAFLKKVFSAHEIDYCFAYKNPETHLAGIFAAKEAASKALGTAKYPFVEIEIRHEKSGMPVAYKNGKRVNVSLSISHTKNIAGAIALQLP